MAFNPANFEYHTMTTGIPGMAEGIVWKYTTTDNLSAIGSHYFDSQGATVRKNDWIAVIAADKNAWFPVADASQNPLGLSVTTNGKFTEVSVFTGMINIP